MRREVGDPLLRVKGMTTQLARALRDHGYYTVEALAIEAPHILLEKVGSAAGLNLERAQQIIREARNATRINFMTISELLEEEGVHLNRLEGGRQDTRRRDQDRRADGRERALRRWEDVSPPDGRGQRRQPGGCRRLAHRHGGRHNDEQDPFDSGHKL